jgi:predicted transcriptional regulator of viral defense system
MRAKSEDLRHALYDVAAPQHGFFTAAQAMMAGYAYANQRYHTDRGEWVKIDRRLFRLANWPTTHPHDELVRWNLWGNGKAAVSHTTALWVHELGLFAPLPIHISVPTEFTRTTDGVVLHHLKRRKDDVMPIGAVQVTTVARSIVDTATMADVTAAQLRRALDDAVQRGLVTTADVVLRAEELGPESTAAVQRLVVLQN